MIQIVQGVIGGGKTVFAVRKMLERVAMGGHVYTNVDVDRKACREWVRVAYGREMRPGQIITLPEAEGVKDWVEFISWGTLEDPILLVIDEAQMFYNSRDWDKTQKEERPMLSFLTQSRKAGVDVVFVSQDAGNVDKQFRVLAESIVTARKLAHIEIPILRIPLVGLFRYIYIEVRTGNAFRSEWWRARQSVFDCYRTEAFLDSMMQGMEETKSRLEKLELEKTPWLRRTRCKLERGDWLERRLGQLLRWVELRQLKKRRYENIRRIDDRRPPDLGRNQSMEEHGQTEGSERAA